MSICVYTSMYPSIHLSIYRSISLSISIYLWSGRGADQAAKSLVAMNPGSWVEVDLWERTRKRKG